MSFGPGKEAAASHESAPAIPYAREFFPEDVRVAMIGDREDLNLISFIETANDSQGMVRPVGLIVPGADLDERVVHAIGHRLDSMRGDSLAVPIETLVDGVAHEWYDFDFHAAEGWQGSSRDSVPRIYAVAAQAEGPAFRYRHVPYEAAKLKQNPNYRAELGAQMFAKVEEMQATHVLLANYKLILDTSFIEAAQKQGIPIVNLHPSVLPKRKGWRPEIGIINDGTDFDAFGWTMHEVVPEIDGGATLAQQRVDLPPENPEIRALLTDQEYADYIEDLARLAIMKNQAKYSAPIMAVYASNVPRKTVYGEEAFAAESPERLEFYHGQEYASQMAAEQAAIGGEPRPYGRVLFDVRKDGEFRTIETILDMPQIAPIEVSHGLTEYQFILPCVAETPDHSIDPRFQSLVEATMAAKAHRRSLARVEPISGRTVGIIEATYDLGGILKAMGAEVVAATEMPVRVTAPRKTL